MSKARTLADFISDGSEFADGTISVAEVSGAAPLASPTFTGTVALSSGTPVLNLTDTDTGADHQINGSSGIGNLAINVDTNGEGSNAGLVFRVGGTSSANEYFRLAANGDARFYDSSSNVLLFVDESGGIVLNDHGVDKDFRVESDNQSHMLFIDAANDVVSIAQATPVAKWLQIGGDPITTIKPSVSINAADDSGVNTSLLIRGGSPTLAFDITAGGAPRILMDESKLRFYTGTLDSIGSEVFTVGQGAGAETVVNEDSVDMDFRVESDNSTHALFVNAAVSRVGIKTSNPDYELQVGDDNTNVAATIAVASAGSSEKRLVFYRASNKDWEIVEDTSENLSINSSGITGKEFVINNASNDTDFRVESNGDTHAIYVNAGNDTVSVRTSSSPDAGAVFRIGGSFQYSAAVTGGTAEIYQSGSGRVFQFAAGSNGQQGYLSFHAMNLNGFIEKRYYFTNQSGSWVKSVDETVASSGTPPTVTYSGNGSTPTITVTGAGTNPTYFGGGFIYYQFRGGVSSFT